jgi:hypothetical protein
LALLETQRRRDAVRRDHRRRPRIAHGRGGAGAGPHRSERRRQDDHLQYRLRAAGAHRRPGAPRRRRHQPQVRARTRSHGCGPDVPAARGLRVAQRPDNIRTAIEIHRSWSGIKDRTVREQVEELIDLVGIRTFADERADAIPTGVARLTELGRALAIRPRCCCSTSRHRAQRGGDGGVRRAAAASRRHRDGDPHGRARRGSRHAGVLVDRRPRLRPRHRLRHRGRDPRRPDRAGGLPRSRRRRAEEVAG